MESHTSAAAVPETFGDGSRTMDLAGELEELMQSPLVLMLKKRLMATWLWQALFVLAVIGGYVAVQLTIHQERERLRFVAMDSRDTFFLPTLVNLKPGKQIHTKLPKWAAEKNLTRSPTGFADPNGLDALF